MLVVSLFLFRPRSCQARNGKDRTKLVEAAHKKSAPTTAAAPTPRPAETRGAMPVKRVVGLAAEAEAAAAEDVLTETTAADVVRAAEVTAAAEEVARVVLVPLQAPEPNWTWPSPIWQAGTLVMGWALEVETAEVMTGATTTELAVLGAAEVARELDVDMTGLTAMEEADVETTAAALGVVATTTADEEATRAVEAAEEEEEERPTGCGELDDAAADEERAAGGV